MENKTIEELLESLAALVSDARGSLFGQDKCMVDREQLLYLVDHLQAQLPTELEEARNIIASANVLRNNAKKDAADTRRQADQVLTDAEERAAKLIEETTIVEFAHKREKEILDDAQEQHDKLISGAVQYAQRIIEEAEQTVSDTLEKLNSGFASLQNQTSNNLGASLKKLSEAKEALQNAGQNG